MHARGKKRERGGEGGFFACAHCCMALCPCMCHQVSIIDGESCTVGGPNHLSNAKELLKSDEVRDWRSG